MSPRNMRTAPPSYDDLLASVEEELERSIVLPNIISYEPYGDQTDFHMSDAFGRILTAGNRAGKTDAMVVDMIMQAMDIDRFRSRPKRWGHGAIQIRIVCVDVTKGVEQIMLPKFKRWMTRDMMIDGDWERSWDSRSLMLTFSNGSTVDFLTYGMTLDKFAGVPRHIICFDEEPPRDIFNECMMRLKDYDGYWVIAATPLQGMEWIYDLLVEPSQTGKLPGVKVFHLDASKNPYLQADDNTRFTIAMDKEEIEIREEGKYIARSGVVFPDFDATRTHVVPPRVFPRGALFYSSVDHGWRNPTAWLWHWVAPNGDIHTFAEHYASSMTVAEHAAVVKAREYGWANADPIHFRRDEIIRTGDPAMKQTSGITGTSVLQEYSLAGVDIGVEGVPHEVMIGIEKMQAYFRLRADGTPRWTISENCPNLIRELRKLRWASYESPKVAYGKNKREEVNKKDDHAFDSARYFATLMPNPTPDKTNLPGADRVTLSYEEMLVSLANDPTVEFLDDNVHGDREHYEVEYEMGDFA